MTFVKLIAGWIRLLCATAGAFVVLSLFSYVFQFKYAFYIEHDDFTEIFGIICGVWLLLELVRCGFEKLCLKQLGLWYGFGTLPSPTFPEWTLLLTINGIICLLISIIMGTGSFLDNYAIISSGIICIYELCVYIKYARLYKDLEKATIEKLVVKTAFADFLNHSQDKELMLDHVKKWMRSLSLIKADPIEFIKLRDRFRPSSRTLDKMCNDAFIIQASNNLSEAINSMVHLDPNRVPVLKLDESKL